MAVYLDAFTTGEIASLAGLGVSSAIQSFFDKSYPNTSKPVSRASHLLELIPVQGRLEGRLKELCQKTTA